MYPPSSSSPSRFANVAELLWLPPEPPDPRSLDAEFENKEKNVPVAGDWDRD